MTPNLSDLRSDYAGAKRGGVYRADDKIHDPADVRPIKWVIVSDGSTDRTDDIVRKYTAQHSWIELVRMPERRERDFSGKVLSFNAGRERVRRT